MSPRIGLDMNTILKTAAEIADENGIESVTLTTLAKKLKIRPPSLYNHFDGLNGLRMKLAVYGLEQLRNRLIRSVIGLSGDDAVRAFAKEYVAFAREHPGLYEATLRAPDTGQPALRHAAEEVVDLVVRVFNHYGLENEMAIHAVRGIRSLLHGFASLEQKGGFGIPLDLDESLHLMIDTFLAGLRTMQQNHR
jgi:AcrR family transcriptional regulator